MKLCIVVVEVMTVFLQKIWRQHSQWLWK